MCFPTTWTRLKRSVYVANHGAAGFSLRDVRGLTGEDVPDIELAAASFPCTDVSLAGARAGLDGTESGLVWEFQRILQEMGTRKPAVVVLENVPGLATSNNGADLHATIGNLNSMGYTCDLLVLDARRFVPQSRSRIFVVGWLSETLRPSTLPCFGNTPRLDSPICGTESPIVASAAESAPFAGLCSNYCGCSRESSALILKLGGMRNFLESFATPYPQSNLRCLARLRDSEEQRWATAYRRTRGGKAVWEIRGDEISGCLRTGRGGV